VISIKCRKCGAVLAVTTGKDSFRTVKVLLCKCGGIEIDLEIKEDEMPEIISTEVAHSGEHPLDDYRW
jgi:hypothetical protein